MTNQGVDNQPVAAGPLSGIRVLNIGTSIVGPWAASLLAHLGADVIKVERPTGEFIRFLHPKQKDVSTCYTASNIHQRSSELDIKQPDQLAAVRRLAQQADILIENFRPGVADRIGLGYEALQQLNPELVYASSTSWGDTGPMRDRAALDPHVQAFSGFGGLNGFPDGKPEMLRFVQMDPNGAIFLAGLTLLGLLERQRFGHACWVKTSHFEMGIAMQMNRAAEGLLTGASVTRLGSASSASAPNQCFATLDGRYIAVACDTQSQWAGFCRAVGREELLADARFATNPDRVEHRGVLTRMLDKTLKAKPSRWWVVQFEREGVPHGFSLDFEQIRRHPQILANDFLPTVHPPHMGPMLVGGLPWEFGETPAHIDPRVAVPGEHTEQVTAEGFGSDLPRIRQSSVTGENQPPLRGLQVVDATQGYAGPFLGLLLAEAGADVTKVEPPGGDWARQLAPRTRSGSSALFEAFNHNKNSVVLDLDDPAGQAELHRLTRDATVLLEDWGPDSAERRNLGYASLAAQNPGLVYLALSPFGERGPLRNHRGSELVIQAMTGYLRLLGKLDGPPARVGADMVGTCAGASAFIAVLAALYHRERTGRGQRVATSLLGSMMCARSHQWAAMTNPDEWLGDSYCTNETDSPHYGYQTRDRPIYMSPSPLLKSEDFFSLLKEIGMHDEVVNNPKLAENWWYTLGMGYLSREAKPIWEKYLSRLSVREVLEIFDRYDGIWAVEFSDLAQLMDHPQVHAIGLVQEVGQQRYVRAPWRTPWGLPELRPAPALDTG